MNKTAGAVILVAVLTFCCWAVQLGGLAALNASCNNAPEELSTFFASQEGMAAQNASQFWADMGAYYDTYTLGQVPACSQVFSFQWWIVVAEFLLIMAIPVAAMSSSMLRHTRLAWVGCLAVMTAFNWMFAARYSNASWRMSAFEESIPDTYTRLNTAYAGYIMVGICNVLWMFPLAMEHEEHAYGKTPGRTDVAKAAAGEERV